MQTFIPNTAWASEWFQRWDPIALQTSQNFLIQKMLQKTLKICVTMPTFFDRGNGGKIWDLFKNFQLKKILRKVQVSLAFFDVVNCNNECKPVKPQLSQNHEKTCDFLKIFWLEKFWINSLFSVNFLDQKNGGKIGHILRFFLEHFLDKKILRCLQCNASIILSGFL